MPDTVLFDRMRTPSCSSPRAVRRTSSSKALKSLRRVEIVTLEPSPLKIPANSTDVAAADDQDALRQIGKLKASFE